MTDDVPHRSRTPEGYQVLEWWSDGRQLTVYVMPDCIEFVRSWGPDIHDDMADGFIWNTGEFREHLAWVLSEKV